MMNSSLKWTLLWTVLMSTAGIISVMVPTVLNLSIELLNDRILHQLISGIVVGVFQAFALRLLFEKTYKWVLLTLLAYIINIFTFNLTEDFFLNAIINNFIVSFFQSIYLIKYLGKKTIFWIIGFTLLLSFSPYLIPKVYVIIPSILISTALTMLIVSFLLGIIVYKSIERKK